MIIGFVQTKGGTGKSTLAVNTAFSESMNRQFPSIALVELDPQGTLKSWWEERDDMGLDPGKVSFHHISSTQKEVFQQGIKSISDFNELMIMDIPGESTGKLHTRFACAFCDLVIIPMRMSTNDESAFMSNLYPIIKEIIRAVPEKKGQFHVLPVFTHPLLNSRHCFDYFEDILPPQISCLPAVFPARTVYENFNRKGFNLNEYAKLVESNKKYTHQVTKAIEDIEKISQTIISIGKECDDSK
ncbi:MAG: ParA family protein [Desulfobacteraceae bacterium]|nr:MAG: ParA family protein [Desulfobacteraceae bacterium]